MNTAIEVPALRRENKELSTKQPATALQFAGCAVAMIAKYKRYRLA
jgi:hypothetical protein